MGALESTCARGFCSRRRRNEQELERNASPRPVQPWSHNDDIRQSVSKTEHDLLLEMHESLATSLQRLFEAGLAIWLAALASVALAWRSSSCKDGAPLPLYGIPVGLIALKMVEEKCAMEAIQDFINMGMNAGTEIRSSILSRDPNGESLPYSLRVVNVFDRTMHRQPASMMEMSDDWRILQVIGIVNVFDLILDCFQVGQVQSCEQHFPVYDKQYGMSWSGIWGMDTLIRKIHLSGLFMIMLSVVFVIQGLRGLRDVCEAKEISRQLKKLPPEICKCSSGLSDAEPRLYKVAGYIKLTSGAADTESVANQVVTVQSLCPQLQKIAEWCCCERASCFYREVVTLHEELYGKTLSNSDIKAASQAEEQNSAILWGSFVRCVLCENLPSIFLTIAFFGMSFDFTTDLGKVKVIGSFLLGILATLSKATKLLVKGPRFACIFVITCLVVAVEATKFVMCFLCDSHMYRVVSLPPHCVPLVMSNMTHVDMQAKVTQ